MTDWHDEANWPAEAVIFRDNLTAELLAEIGAGPVTLQGLMDAVRVAMPEAYLQTLRDCMVVKADLDRSSVVFSLPPWLMLGPEG